MTNREWLNTLTDEEFADWCTDVDVYDFVKGKYVGIHPHRANIVRMCNSGYCGILGWLKEDKINGE